MEICKWLIYLFKWNGKYDISPFHIFLASLILIPLLFMNFINNAYEVILGVFFYVVYTVNYYIQEKNEKNITFWQSIKNDFPNFQKNDMNVWHILLFLLILAPFILFFGSLFMAMF